jgi:hypothetical protein
METNKRINIKLNSDDKIEQLLQESYNNSCRQYIQIQEEINKIANTTVINNLDIDGKEKYAKIMNNYLTLLQKANAQKVDIAKLLTEIKKMSGNVNEALNNLKSGNMTLDVEKLRKLAINAAKDNDGEKYQLNK